MQHLSKHLPGDFAQQSLPARRAWQGGRGLVALIVFENSFAEKLPGFFVRQKADQVKKPELIRFNRKLALELGVDKKALAACSDQDLAIFFINPQKSANTKPLAQIYAGHQFGNFVPQLGDGRALLIGETIDKNGRRFDIQLKGSGPTPFSRGGDGKSALGPVLREYLISEAMHALDIPTTRALAALTSGEHVYRDVPEPGEKPGGIFVRVAASHLRIGSFQFFAARGQFDLVGKLLDYAIWRHYPKLSENKNPALALLMAVANRQAKLIAKWMGIGFVHGVMNTDNTTISGETIDYGPCAFIDYYDPKACFSSIDRRGRYAYQNQPKIIQWNLARLAECLLPLIDDNEKKATKKAIAVIDGMEPIFQREWQTILTRKIGLADTRPNFELGQNFLDLLERQQVDFTLAFRHLSDAIENKSEALDKLFADSALLEKWLKRWRTALKRSDKKPTQIKKAMDKTNPLIIPRNHKVEEAIAAACDHQSFILFERLLGLITKPFIEHEDAEAYILPAQKSDTPYQTFCGT